MHVQFQPVTPFTGNTRRLHTLTRMTKLVAIADLCPRLRGGCETSDKIRDGLDIGADTKALILIGKDGWVERRAPLNSQLSDFFAQIDGMPMRQLETKEKRGLVSRLPSTWSRVL